MKRLAALLLCCFASVSHAAHGPRVQGLSWGTWTPQGFVASSDVTTLSGATQVVDTTGPILTDDWDWTPQANYADVNGANLHAFKIFVGGTPTSCDSAFVTVEWSIDGSAWWVANASGTAWGMTQFGAGGGTHSLYSINVGTAAPVRGPFSLSGSTVGLASIPAPARKLRFIVRPDGNTSASFASVKLHVSYMHTDGRQGDPPRFEWTRLGWQTYGPNGPMGSTNKDTSSVRFSAPDTTSRVDWTTARIGLGSITSADTTAAGAYLWLNAASDESSNDSLYVLQDGSADGYRWSVTPLIAGTHAGGSMAAAATTGGATGAVSNALFGLPSYSVTTTHGSPGMLMGTPFTRYRVFGGNGGEVAGGMSVWVGRFVIPGD